MPQRRPLAALSGVLVSLGLLAAACGGSDSEAPAAEATPQHRHAGGDLRGRPFRDG